ncbi:MAG: hypothetical protein KF812_08800 [Fimbriimonadaceae bacterium]|nr:hypothetical protein [Fimbriimonadaceae bacterium]
MASHLVLALAFAVSTLPVWQISAVSGDNYETSAISYLSRATASNNTGSPYDLPIVSIEVNNQELVTGYPSGAVPFPMDPEDWAEIEDEVGNPGWTVKYNEIYDTGLIPVSLTTQNPTIQIPHGWTADAKLTHTTYGGREIHYLVDTSDENFSWGSFPILEGQEPDWFFGTAFRLWVKTSYPAFGWTLLPPSGGGGVGG